MTHRSARASTVLVALVAATVLGACSPDKEESPRPSAASSAASISKPADVQKISIGEFTAIALRDGGLEVPNDNKTFGVGRTPAEVAAVLTAAGLPTDKLQLSIQPLLVKTADRVLLFDTGAGANMGPNGGKFTASLAAAHVDPADVTDVFISHSHGDHIGGLVNPHGTLAFPNAAIHISSPEWAYPEGMVAEAAAGKGIQRHAALVSAVAPKVAEFAPDAEILPGIVKAVEIRGHTPGHSGFLITSGQSSLLYVGDAIHHFVVSVQKPEWTIDFDADASTAEASRADLLARSAANGQRIYAVHFPFPGVGKIARREAGFVWVPEY